MVATAYFSSNRVNYGGKIVLQVRSSIQTISDGDCPSMSFYTEADFSSNSVEPSDWLAIMDGLGFKTRLLETQHDGCCADMVVTERVNITSLEGFCLLLQEAISKFISSVSNYHYDGWMGRWVDWSIYFLLETLILFCLQTSSFLPLHIALLIKMCLSWCTGAVCRIYTEKRVFSEFT